MLRNKFCKILSGSLLSMVILFNTVSVNAKGLYNSVNEFVVKSYDVFLGRSNLDDVGIDYWSYLIENHNESLYNYMISMISGSEFLSKDITDEEFLNMIYKLFFNKLPDENEKYHWLTKIQEKNNEINDIDKSRIEIAKEMFHEDFFEDFAYTLGTTHRFENMNNFGVKELRSDYDQQNIEYINKLYEDFYEFGKDLYNQIEGVSSEENLVTNIISKLPIFVEDALNNKYEDISSVSGDGLNRIVYDLDYKIEFPYDQKQCVYISPFLQLNSNEKMEFITLGLSLTSRSLGKEVTKAELILGNKSLELEVEYKDHSKYDEKGISLHEFKLNIRSADDLILLDKILSSDLSKLRFTFDDSTTYIYNLYEKDRVRNTLRFMSNVYLQIIVPYLIETQNTFNTVIVKSLE